MSLIATTLLIWLVGLPAAVLACAFVLSLTDRRRGLGGLALAAAVAMLLITPGLAQAGKRATSRSLPPELYGVNAQAVFDMPEGQVATHLAAMRDDGLSVVRKDASWGSIEPTPPDPETGVHGYRWDRTDAMVGALASHGLRWYPILDYSAPWAASTRGNIFSPPANDQDFAAFARALAGRYGTGGQYWREHPELNPVPVTSYEVWNEENSSRFWTPQLRSADRYADLYLATR